jgi:predicted nicotinamide N-methyase
LLGIALASAGAQIVLTDQKPMLPLLQQNVDSNIRLNKYKVSVAELDWSADTLLLPLTSQRGSNVGNLKTPFDVIVGTDGILHHHCIVLIVDVVTYEEEGIIPLMKTLLALSDVNTEIYIAHEERNMDAESIFYTLVYKNFEYQKVTCLMCVWIIDNFPD